jgi:hypothetical protein
MLKNVYQKMLKPVGLLLLGFTIAVSSCQDADDELLIQD